jgi:mutator protein MutT
MFPHVNPMADNTKSHKHIGVAVVWNEAGQVLIDRRKPEGSMGGLWEFPGGKVEPGESVPDCIRREIQEELAIEIEVGNPLIAITHDYPEFQVTLDVYHCRHISGEPQLIECDAIEWVTIENLNNYTFPEANVQIIEAIQQDAQRC